MLYSRLAENSIAMDYIIQIISRFDLIICFLVSGYLTYQQFQLFVKNEETNISMTVFGGGMEARVGRCPGKTKNSG